MPDDQWTEIDAKIKQRLIIQAIKLIRETRNVRLREAMEINSERYKYLRAMHPDAFVCSHENYWDGCYS